MRRVLLRSRSMPRKARGREACSGVNSTTGAARKGREWKGGKQMQGAQSSTTVLRLCVRSHPPPGPSRISVAGAAAARENPLKATVDGGTEQERGPLQLVEEAEDPSSTSRRRWWWEGRETGGRSSAPPPRSSSLSQQHLLWKSLPSSTPSLSSSPPAARDLAIEARARAPSTALSLRLRTFELPVAANRELARRVGGCGRGSA